MKCPSCKDATLTITERQGVEIDYCPECRGVWLDRGELDKLIERSERSERSSREPSRGDDDDFDSRGRRRSPKSLLRDLFG
ncbi:MAG: zf-TFIIB domain-containing protein [Truepera sp.]|nr:zf-TFIIB domain-containing protein [Truepera sp.]MBS3966499.1 zf-TFIIB domain-containing protein [Truepera sp.]